MSCANCASSAPSAPRTLATSGASSPSRARLRERRDEQAERVQRLAKVVARGGEELALAAVRGFGRRARVDGGARARLELGDQVDVSIAHRERVGQHVVQPVAEREHEAQHDRHHQRRVADAPGPPSSATRTISGTSAGSTKP